MLCAKCPFSLRCYASRLDAEEPVSLCVKCGVLVACVENTYYSFMCERRPLLDEHRAAFKKQRQQGYPQHTMIDQLRVDDHGPGLSDKLIVHYCLTCLNSPSMRRIYGVVVNLDELAKAKEDGGSHPFELAGSTTKR